VSAPADWSKVAAGPGEWAASVLQERYDRWAEHDVDPQRGAADDSWMSVDDVVADDGAWLRAVHHRLMTGHSAPADTAASYLTGWYAGAIVDVVGYGLATARAGLLLDADTVRLHVHPDGWIDRIELVAPTALVPAGHPWAGRPGVEVDDADRMLHRCVAGAVALVRPIVDGCHGLARVGRAGLWNEVGDSLGLAFDDAVPATEPVRELLMAAVSVPGVPWRAKPSIEIVDDGVLGLAFVRRKGGCCLAYQCDHGEATDHDADNGAVDPDLQAFRERFGADDGPHYCTTCKFRDPDDSRERQLFWRRLELARRTSEVAG
jgi:hypothetical protein